MVKSKLQMLSERRRQGWAEKCWSHLVASKFNPCLYRPNQKAPSKQEGEEAVDSVYIDHGHVFLTMTPTAYQLRNADVAFVLPAPAATAKPSNRWWLGSRHH